MAGNVKPVVTPLKTATSSKTEDQRGVTHSLPPVKLALYEVNIRSFHPNKKFERLGLRFHGDDRGFSVGESWFGNENTNQGKPTSRIWQRYKVDLAWNKTGDLSAKDSTAEPRTESNISSGDDHWFWGMFGGDEPYEDAKMKPRGKLVLTEASEPHGGQKILRLKSHFAGENHAFRASGFMERHAGVTHVPTLDVFNELFIRVERINRYMDIMSLAYGDGFPNCEQFIKDPAGNALVLGTHVRIGFPATHLWSANQRLMWANVLRVELTPEGNFGDRLWLYSHVLGGSKEMRDDYPVSKLSEVCLKDDSQPTQVVSNPLSPNVIMWPCGKLESIEKKQGPRPLHLSAFTDVAKVRAVLNKVWQSDPLEKTSVSAWNNEQLQSNPNAGRAKDDFDVAEEKWKKANQAR